MLWLVIAFLVQVIVNSSKAGSPVCPFPAFSYWVNGGAANWPTQVKTAATCNSTVRQSPVALSYPSAIYNNLLAYSLRVSLNATLDSASTLEIQNDGLKVHLAYSSPVTLQGLALDGAFLLDHIHVHWGDTDARGSEHSLDGTFFPAEIHMVFYKASDGNFATALQFVDHIAVLGIFIKTGSFNKVMDQLISQIGQTITPCSTANVPAAGIPPNAFLPTASSSDEELAEPSTMGSTCGRRRFYRYEGSLTTPACNEVVLWTVFATPLEISADQMNQLRQLQNAWNGTMVNNNRPTQALGQRPVYRSYSDTVWNCKDNVEQLDEQAAARAGAIDTTAATTSSAMTSTGNGSRVLCVFWIVTSALALALR
jgi:carbonic anhydrase